MAAPPDSSDTWLHFIHAKYYDDAPGPACHYCNPNPIQIEEGDVEANQAGPSNPNPNPGQRKQVKECKSPTKVKTGKECKRFFCIPCKQGGLCGQEFHLEGRPHFDHPHLSIYRTSYENSVRIDHMVGYLDTTGVMGICSNNHVMHNLCTRKASQSVKNVIYCQGCRENVANAKSFHWREANARDAIVCSIQCLLELRARNAPASTEKIMRPGRKQRKPVRSPLM